MRCWARQRVKYAQSGILGTLARPRIMGKLRSGITGLRPALPWNRPSARLSRLPLISALPDERCISGLSLPPPLTPPFSCPACPRSLVFILPLPHRRLTHRVHRDRPYRLSMSRTDGTQGERTYEMAIESRPSSSATWRRGTRGLRFQVSLERRKPQLYRTLLSVSSGCSGNPDAKRLYDDLLSNYNKLVRPVVNVTDALTVKIKLKLSQLIDVVSDHVVVSCLVSRRGASYRFPSRKKANRHRMSIISRQTSFLLCSLNARTRRLSRLILM